jgi:N-acetylmuramoyl-L-alanine amidase
MSMYTVRKSTAYLVVHCSATQPKSDIGAKEIRQWHREKGWIDIGYHFVIRRDGQD